MLAGFRVLQFVIAVLLILFLFSGFKTIGNNEAASPPSGARLRMCGAQAGAADERPPPVGDFVLVSTEMRRRMTVDGSWPQPGCDQRGRAVQQATYEEQPGRDFRCWSMAVNSASGQAQFEVDDVSTSNI